MKKLTLSEIIKFSLFIFFSVWFVALFVMSRLSELSFSQTFQHPYLSSLSVLLAGIVGGIYCLIILMDTNEIKPKIVHKVQEITATVNNPFLKSGSKGKLITVDGKEADFYPVSNMQFNFFQYPFQIVAGSSGSGKTTGMFSVIKEVQRQYPECRFIIADAGIGEWEGTIAHSVEEINNLWRNLYIIMKGRQLERESGVKDHKPLYFILEEAESYFSELSLDKTASKEILVKVASVFRMARKTALFGSLVTQSSKATDIPTQITNNAPMRLIFRFSKSAGYLGCEYNVRKLPTGISYFSPGDFFVQFPKADPPKLPTMTMKEVIDYANSLKAKYPQINE